MAVRGVEVTVVPSEPAVISGIVCLAARETRQSDSEGRVQFDLIKGQEYKVFVHSNDFKANFVFVSPQDASFNMATQPTSAAAGRFTPTTLPPLVLRNS